MCREIQNPQIFQPNPESFSRAIIFSWTRRVSVAKELSNKMYMSAHVNDSCIEKQGQKVQMQPDSDAIFHY
jgi:hypothetical protein